MKKSQIVFLLIVGIMALLPVSAATISNGEVFGEAGAVVTVVSQNGGGTTYDQTQLISDKEGTVGGSAAGLFEWSMAYNVDPSFTYNFTSLMPGIYTVNLVLPVVGGPYNFLTHSATGSIAALAGDTTISARTAAVEIPTSVSFGAGAFDLMLAGSTVFQPFSLPISSGAIMGGIAPISPVSMGVTLSWTHTGPGSVNLQGGLVLVENAVPEPATFAVAGIAVLGLGLLRLRRV